MTNWHGTDWLTLVGGTLPTVGVENMQIYTFALDKKRWQKVKVQGSAPQTKGTRPALTVEDGRQFLFTFSGQA